MRVVVTGGAGFIGRHVVKVLADRGDQVVALVRDPARTDHLAGPNVTLVGSDLKDPAQLRQQMAAADAVIHGAGMYVLGIKKSERPAMWDANVGTTERVLDAAIAAKVPRILYLSTVGVFGDTHGKLADETYRRDLSDGFVSWYDETKYRAHEAAEKRVAAGAPIVIVQPSQVYGRHDHSIGSLQLERAYHGTLKYTALTDGSACWVHVDDLTQGIVAALDKGRLGESYILSGDPKRMIDAIAIAAAAGGRKPPRTHMPTSLLKLMAPINDRVGGLPGMPGGMRDIIRASDGVTYLGNHDKATRELGFNPRTLEQGLVDTWGKTTAKEG
jgi:dihydroflavonol-4-reductase/farnesol dehydrogenase